MLRTGLTLIWFAGAAAAAAAIPPLDSAVNIQCGGAPLQVNTYSAPSVVDWNCDGKKDLLVGQRTSGYVYLYLNSGTDANPTFNSGALVTAGGSPITVGG